jgi:hypothetical protein
MLTQEQIKNLKKGDPVIIHGEFMETWHDGDIKIFRKVTERGKVIDLYAYFHPSCVSLPSEHGTFLSRRSSEGAETEVPTTKRDSFRLFRKGDRISFKTWHGFLPSDLENEAELLGKEATVYEDQEEDNFRVYFFFDGEDPEQEWHAAFLPFIELVTPVEELEPYKLIDSPNTYNIVRDSAMVMTIHKKSHPNAKAAAEAERDRLNAEWRKEHENED